MWAPDSERAAFTSLNERQVLRVLNTRDAGSIRDVWQSEVYMYPSDWSPDGRHLLFTANAQDTSNDIWSLPMAP